MGEIIQFQARRRRVNATLVTESVQKVVDGKVVEYVDVDQLSDSQRRLLFASNE